MKVLLMAYGLLRPVNCFSSRVQSRATKPTLLRADLIKNLFGAAAPPAQPDESPPVAVPFVPLPIGPSWIELQAIAEATPVGQQQAADRAAWAVGAGPAHTDAALRLFGTQGEPRVVFYRDRAGWCPYCQKVDI